MVDVRAVSGLVWRTLSCSSTVAPFHDRCFLRASSSNSDSIKAGSTKKLVSCSCTSTTRRSTRLTAGRFAQDSEGPDEGQISPSGFAASVGIIEQKLIGVKLLREGYRFPFSWIKEAQRRVENGTQRAHVQPRGRTRDPAADDIRRFLVPQLLENRRRNQNSIEELRKEVHLMNEDQVVQWR
jgi:hypothetical protein